MKNDKKIAIIVILVIVTISLSAIIFSTGLAIENNNDSSQNCVLSSYGNNVALYVNGELKEVYPDIVLDTLTTQDIKQLKQGIYFTSIEEAKIAIEDYDG